MPNTRDLIPGERIFAIFKGEPGSGKGAAAESFPGPYVMDLDRRIRSTLKMHPGKEIDYDQFDSIEQVLNKIDALINRCDYETVHIASLTKLANMAVEYSMKHRGAGKETNAQKDIQGLSRGKIQLTDVTDWGVEFRVLTRIVDGLQLIRANIILEAHLMTVTSDNIITGKSVTKRRLMTGAKGVAAYLPTCFDEIYHFYTETGLGAVGSDNPPTYKVATQDVGEDYAKTALWLPPTIEWTNKDFYKILQGYIKTPYASPVLVTLPE